MGDASDAELIRSWQRGAPPVAQAAFTELVRRWQQPVARFLGRMTSWPDLVPDLCQEVFLRVYRGASRYRHDGAFSTWLYRIAINVAHDAGRRFRVRRDWGSPIGNHVDARAGPAIADAQSPAPDETCERRELAAAVAGALAELPEEQRLALVLRHYEGMSFEEMARLTGVPASTIKSRFTAALKRLRTRLEQLGWGPEEVGP